MRRAILSAALLLGAAAASKTAEAAGFPYPVHRRTLANGLEVLVVPTPEFKGVLSYNTLVLAGSRHELEPGKTGLAHLFEHILFRHRAGGRENGYQDAIDRLGTHNNAWTWFDVTYFHLLSFADALPELTRLEAERFTRLDFSERTFKTEGGAVLGEYRRQASFPTMRLSERLTALMFPGRGYGHTTMGSYEDVLDMPREYSAARRFYAEHYNPENCVIVAAGDVDPEAVFKAVEKEYSAWPHGRPSPAPAAPATPEGPLTDDLGWDSAVAPVVWAAWRMPAFVPGSAESAVGRVLDELLISPVAPLTRRLRSEERLVSQLGFADGIAGYESSESRALTLSAQLFQERWDAEGEPYIRRAASAMVEGVEGLARFSERPGAAAELEVLKSKKRFDLLGELSSPARIAAVVAHHYRFGRDLGVFERMDAALAALTPADIDAFARRWFTPENRAVLTLAHREGMK